MKSFKTLLEDANKLKLPADSFGDGTESVKGLERTFKKSNPGEDIKKWAKTVDLSEPIDITIFNNGEIGFSDGHHRVLAAKLLNKKLNVNIERNELKQEIFLIWLEYIKKGYSKILMNPNDFSMNRTYFDMPTIDLMDRADKKFNPSRRGETVATDIFNFYQEELSKK